MKGRKNENRNFALLKLCESDARNRKNKSEKRKGLRFVPHSASRSVLVGMTGFEPATPRPPGVYATGLRYIPKYDNKNVSKIFIR